MKIQKCSTIRHNYSTVTELSSSTPSKKYIPFLKFVCVIIYYKGSIVSIKYTDFDIVFIEKVKVMIGHK